MLLQWEVESICQHCLLKRLVKLVNDLEEVEGSEIGIRYKPSKEAENDLLELVRDIEMADHKHQEYRRQ